MCCVVWIRLGRAVEEKKEKEKEQEPPRATVETIGYQTRYPTPSPTTTATTTTTTTFPTMCTQCTPATTTATANSTTTTATATNIYDEYYDIIIYVWKRKERKYMFDDDVILLLIIDINNIDYVFEKWFILWCINNNKKIWNKILWCFNNSKINYYLVICIFYWYLWFGMEIICNVNFGLSYYWWWLCNSNSNGKFYCKINRIKNINVCLVYYGMEETLAVLLMVKLLIGTWLYLFRHGHVAYMVVPVAPDTTKLIFPCGAG